MTTTAAPSDLRARVLAIRDGLRAATVARDEQVDALCLGLATPGGAHVLMLGPPGSAKSLAARWLAACVTGAAYFETLLTRFSTEADLCGAVDLATLRASNVVQRATTGKLPSAHFAFLDETFKGNGSVLNATLSILNERRFEGSPCPLRMAVGASNECPADEELAAFSDRWLLRTVTDYVQGADDFVRMIRASQARAAFTPPATLTITEIDALRADAARVDVPDRILRELHRVIDACRAQGIKVSDRRAADTVAALQAAAWLNGDVAAELDHVADVGRFTLWITPDQVSTAAAILRTVDLGPLREVTEIIDRALRVYEGRPSDPAAYRREAPAIVDALEKAGAEVQTYRDRLSKRAATKVRGKLAALRTARDRVQADVARMYGMPGAALSAEVGA